MEFSLWGYDVIHNVIALKTDFSPKLIFPQNYIKVKVKKLDAQS